MKTKKFCRKSIRSLKTSCFLNSLDRKQQPQCDETTNDSHISQQRSCLFFDRKQVIEQILFLGGRYKVGYETTFLALAYLQCFEDGILKGENFNGQMQLDKKVYEEQKQKKIAYVLFSLCSKFNDIDYVEIERLAKCELKTFTKSLVEIERHVLFVTDFSFPQRTPFTYFYDIAEKRGEMASLKQLCYCFESFIMRSDLYENCWETMAEKMLSLRNQKNSNSRLKKVLSEQTI